MAEYIEKTQLIEKLKHRVSTNDDSKFATGFIKGTNEALGIIEEWIASIPAAADVAPVVHGHWRKSKEGVCGDYLFVCSACGADYWESPSYCKQAHYCPNCGAKMD